MHPVWRGPLLVAALALIWGSNFAWIKVSLEAFTPTQLTFGRMLLGALVLGVVIALQRQALPRERIAWVHLVVAALVANALPYLLFAVAETRVDSGTAGVINTTTPLWTLAIVAALRQGEPVTTRQIAGFLLGLLGCLVLLAPWNAGTVDVLGALACLAAALCYAVSFVYMARYLTPRVLTPIVLSGVQLLAATGWTLLALAPRPGPAPTSELGPWLAMIVLGILGTGVAYVINYALIRTEGAAGASVVIYLLPVVSIAFGATILAEPLTVNLLVGTLVILVGVVLSRARTHGQTRHRSRR
jgi:drug/metabolite transporter (DMT)-like permease